MIEEEAAPVEEESEEVVEEEAAPAEVAVEEEAVEEESEEVVEEEAAPVEEESEEVVEEESAPVEEEAAPAEEAVEEEGVVLDNVDDENNFVYDLSFLQNKPNEVAWTPNAYKGSEYIWIKGPDGNSKPYRLSSNNVGGSFVGSGRGD